MSNYQSSFYNADGSMTTEFGVLEEIQAISEAGTA